MGMVKLLFAPMWLVSITSMMEKLLSAEFEIGYTARLNHLKEIF